jgi:hypothetical protein
MFYYKRLWNETTGDPKTDNWGTSTYYLETDSDGNVTRQMQVFANGNILKYDENFVEDPFGFLADQPLDLEEFSDFKIMKEEFENDWNKSMRKTL